MKYLKTFENISIHIDDYVVLRKGSVKLDNQGRVEKDSKFENQIGKFVYLNNTQGTSPEYHYNIYFYDYNTNKKYAVYIGDVNVKKEDIEFSSNNKEDAETYLKSRKYNL